MLRSVNYAYHIENDAGSTSISSSSSADAATFSSDSNSSNDSSAAAATTAYVAASGAASGYASSASSSGAISSSSDAQQQQQQQQLNVHTAEQPCANFKKRTTKLCRRRAAVYYCSVACQKVCFKDPAHTAQCEAKAYEIM
jgi:membrane protease subunit (stomatin/prohibitin family)